MHEAFIGQALFDTAIAAIPAPGDRITKVTVVAGPFAAVGKDALEFYFTHICKGSPAEGSILEIKPDPAQIICSICGQQMLYDGTAPLELQCKHCNSSDCKIHGGKALYLDSIEVEQPD